MNQRKRSENALGAFLRQMLGWRASLPEKERNKIKRQAAAILAGKGDSPWTALIEATREGRKASDTLEAAHKKSMERLAAQLPVWKTFGEDIRGFGAISLAVIIAEAGDLDDYPSHAKLWKRMGLAVIDGAKQGTVPKGLSREATKEAWIARRYSPVRRSHIFMIGESLVKAQVRQVRDTDNNDTGERVALGPYGEAYLRRKEHTQRTHPEWWCDKDGKPKLDPDTGRPISDHGNYDAQRYIEKRLLRDLWKAWRRAGGPVSKRTTRRLSAANHPAHEVEHSASA
jgi:hypothetical protein